MPNKLSKLENELLSKFHDQRTGKNRYSNDEMLDSLVTVVTAVIYNLAEDHGHSLAHLEQQFAAEVHNRILLLDHDAEYHDLIDHTNHPTSH